MPAQSKIQTVNPKIERIANILRLIGWVSFWLQAGLGVASALMLVFAISGRSFSQAVAPTPGVPVTNYSQGTTPGVSISIFWGVCGILALLFGIYLAFSITRFARRLCNPNPDLHPKKADVMKVLRIAIITGFLGMLLTILGGGAGISVLLSKSIAQPQGVAIYDPNRIIRSLDIFVAMASMTGITAHYIATVASLGLFNWLHPQL
ncbi:MAG: DUF3611 family protein [Fischerella sp.]|nr:DUF3611 family protein [Fischerella sp.]